MTSAIVRTPKKPESEVGIPVPRSVRTPKSTLVRTLAAIRAPTTSTMARSHGFRIRPEPCTTCSRTDLSVASSGTSSQAPT